MQNCGAFLEPHHHTLYLQHSTTTDILGIIGIHKHGCFTLYKWWKLSLEWKPGTRKIGFLEGKTLTIYLAFFSLDTSRSDNLFDKEV